MAWPRAQMQLRGTRLVWWFGGWASSKYSTLLLSTIEQDVRVDSEPIAPCYISPRTSPLRKPEVGRDEGGVSPCIGVAFPHNLYRNVSIVYRSRIERVSTGVSIEQMRSKCVFDTLRYAKPPRRPTIMH